MRPDFSKFTEESEEILGIPLWDHLCEQYHENNLDPDDVMMMLERAYKTGFEHCKKELTNEV